MSEDSGDIALGARNLLVDCGGLRAGNRVLIVHEPTGLGYYCEKLVQAVAQTARDLGLKTQLWQEPFSAIAVTPGPALERAMGRVDLTVFLARFGDQIRYKKISDGHRAIVCYALDIAMLGSRFGQVNHRAMIALRDTIDTALQGAREIHITCPAGTDFRGKIDAQDPDPVDTNTIRFPLSVHTPVPALRFSGTIVQRGFLVGTGSNYYTPYSCGLRDPLNVHFSGNCITGFSGDDDDVSRAKAHYAMVANRYGIDRDFVHSWHAGIHPGCAFPAPAMASFERWTGGAFGNPRVLHIHTCGA